MEGLGTGVDPFPEPISHPILPPALRGGLSKMFD